MNFTKGQAVKFKRTEFIKNDATVVAAVVDASTYVIEESVNGWNPDTLRVTKYELDAQKKYLFAEGKELTAI